jgi:NAD(P)-dependent dehydrogenase (short-subunit alcohol dehydrogenase family)
MVCYRSAVWTVVQVCLITGGDSGIGRSVALMYAREGAEAIAISYLDEERDAEVHLTSDLSVSACQILIESAHAAGGPCQ